MKTKLLFLTLIFLQVSFAQQRTCGMNEHMKQIMFNPVLKKQHQERQAKFQQEYKKLLENNTTNNRILNPNVTINIPVAVHFPSITNTTAEATKILFRNFAQTQIDVINADFNASNTDIANWPSAAGFYPGVSVGNLDVQFTIATQNHPTGTGLVNGVRAITFGTDFLNDDDSDPTWAGYMNFVVRDLGSGLLGYSPLGGSPGAGQTVVMNTNCYGSGSGVPGTTYIPQAPYNLGRTVTHELGHFFNLDHTFANDNGCFGTDDDGVVDTPRCGFAEFGCPSIGSIDGCVFGEKQLTMNYMDYTNDACMYMFSAGQATRARAYINTILAEYKTNVLAASSFTTAAFSVYPNPSNGELNITFNEVFSDYTIEIIDSTGKKVYQNNMYKNSDLVTTIKLPNELSTGLYLLNVKTNDATFSKKIIIK
jgi:hypothetical protein